MFSKTFAELNTPGTPAPGCVPAPTKNRFLKSSDLLLNLNHADYVKIGDIEKPEPL